MKLAFVLIISSLLIWNISLEIRMNSLFEYAFISSEVIQSLEKSFTKTTDTLMKTDIVIKDAVLDIYEHINVKFD